MSKYERLCQSAFWNTRAPERAVPASTHGTCTEHAARALTIGPAAHGRPAEQSSHLARPAGRVEHGPSDQCFRQATDGCSCSHASPSAARLSEGACSCDLASEDSDFLAEEITLLAGGTSDA